jgi:hypothetical protein
MFTNGLKSLKKGASSVANKASAVAKDTSNKVAKAGLTTENVKKAGVQGSAMAKKVVVGAVNTLVTPELIAFCKNPSAEKLQANPQIVLTALTILTALGNPQAAVGRALLLSSVAVGAGLVAKTGEKAVHVGTANIGGAVIQQQTGGFISQDQAATALKQMSPDQMKELLKIVQMSTK